MYYFSRKTELKEKARKHTEKMAEEQSESIRNSIVETEVWCDDGKFCNNTEITVIAEDSVTAVMNEYRTAANSIRPVLPLAVLNFASYKNPGGMFFEGSSAQEESLCHESTLYNVIKEFPEYYGWNDENKNRGLYQNRALYSRNIYFEKEVNGTKEVAYADVITCAAPNKSAAQKYQKVKDEENLKVLRDRCKFVLDLASRHGVRTLILGAYGCGVFGQDPAEVAECFRSFLTKEYKGYFKKVVFAIPDASSENYKTFKSIFGK